MEVVSLVKIVTSSVILSVVGESEKVVFSFGKKDLSNTDRTKLNFLAFTVYRLRQPGLRVT